MFERFSDRTRKVLALANQEAQRFSHECLGPEHILLGLIKEGNGVGTIVLRLLKVDLALVRAKIEACIKPGPEMVTMGKLPQTPRAKLVVEHALKVAEELKADYVGTEHLLLGLLKEGDGIAAQVLKELGVTYDAAKNQIIQLTLSELKDSVVGAKDDLATRAEALVRQANWAAGVTIHMTKVEQNNTLPPGLYTILSSVLQGDSHWLTVKDQMGNIRLTPLLSCLTEGASPVVGHILQIIGGRGWVVPRILPPME